MAKRSSGNRTTAIIAGLGLFLFGSYLFAALASFDPRSVPGWAPLISSISTTTGAPANLGGPIGSLLAGYMLFLFGGAAYLLSVTCLGYGIAAVTTADFNLRDKAGWGLLMVLLGACLLQLQPVFLLDWKEELRIDGPGGFLGLWIGERAVHGLLGPASFLLLLGLYLASLLFTISSHPLRDLGSLWRSIMAWRATRRAAKLARMDEERQIEEQRRSLEKTAGKLERKLKKKGIDLPTEPSTPVEQEDEEDRPEPDIIDATAPLPVPFLRGHFRHMIKAGVTGSA
jgi:S-DNA-T family DNA segregation ATPase FtsK/SpoIIIE